MNATFKPLVVAALVAAFSAGSAQAEVKNAGTVGTTPVATTFTKAPGDFFDKLNFTVTGPSVLSVSATSLEASLLNSPLFSIGELGLMLWTGPAGSANSVHVGDLIGDGSTVTFNLLAGGTYHFNILGSALGSNGGIYTVGMSAAPVPEPETYAMLLAGLGMLGFMARRRMAN